MAKDQWLWKKYERAYWMDDGERRLYIGHFVALPQEPGDRYKECCIRFWARHPRRALRKIIASGKHPMIFDFEIIN